jgi:uncharacterized protein (UPF0332 family)
VRRASDELVVAREELALAQELRGNDRCRLAVTHAYFAQFHAMRASLFGLELSPTTRAETDQLVAAHFDADTVRFADILRRQREAATYGSHYAIAQDDLSQIIDKVTALLAVVETRIGSTLSS